MASPSISFDQIPYSWKRKGVYAEIKPRYDRKGLYDYPTKVLIVGQMAAGATAAALVKKPITRDTEAPAFFGAGSPLAQMVTAFRKINKVSEVWAMGVADAAGSVANVRTITITGTPTDSGTLSVYIGGKRVQVGVSTADTVTTIATALAAAINEDTSLVFTASSAAGVVTETAKAKGTCGNLVDHRLNYYDAEVTPPGISVVFAQSTAGATDPSIQGVFDLVTNEWFTDFPVQWSDAANMALIDAEMVRRYDAMAKLDAHAYVGLSATYAAATTWSSTRNCPFVSAIPAKAALNAPWEWAAVLAAIATRYLTDDPSRQLGSLVMTDLKAPKSEDCFTEDEQNLLLNKGLSAFDRQDDGSVTVNRVVTTYQKTSAGVDDEAWLDIMVPKTMSRIRYDWNTFVSAQYPRAKLVADESPAANKPSDKPGDNVVVTPRKMTGTWMSRAKKYHDAVWIQNIAYTRENSFFSIDPDDRDRLNGRQPVMIAGNLIMLAGLLEFAA